MTINGLTAEDINIFSTYLVNFLFILLRAGIFMSLMPVLGEKKFPRQFRIGFVVCISLLLTPLVHFEFTKNEIPMIIIKEMIIAMALGFTVRFVFMAINMAGQFISHAMGMSIARVFNPDIGQSTQIAEAYGLMAVLLFLSMDAHHDLIFVFVKSFEILPAGQVSISAIAPELQSMGSKLFVLSLKIGAPAIVGLLISHLLTGFLYKAAPQMNIFFVAWPLNIFLGFLLIIMSIPVFVYVMEINFNEIQSDMIRILSLAKG